MGFLDNISDMFKKENKMNLRGNKDGFWKENSYSEDGGIVQSEGHYKDGEKIGIWTTSSNEEIKKMNYIIEGDKRIEQELYDNEKVKTERIFQQGEFPVEIGQKEYYENGQLKEEYKLETDGKTEYKRYDENGILRVEGTEKIIDKEKIVTTKAYDFNENNNYTIREEHFDKNGKIKQDRFSSYEGIDNLKYVRDKKIEKGIEFLKTSITVEHYNLGKLADRTIEQTTEDKESETTELRVYDGKNLYREEFSKISEKESFTSLKQYREDGGLIFDYEKVTANEKTSTSLNFYDKEGNLQGDTQYSQANNVIGVGKYNENGEKEGFWGEGNFNSTGYLGLLEIKDVADLFEQSGNYVNGKREGKWKSYDDFEIGDIYSEQHMYKIESEYKEGKLNGKVSIFSIDSNREEKKLLDLEYKENSLTNYNCYAYVPNNIELPNSSSYSLAHSPYDKTINFKTGEYEHKITIEENGNTNIENYKEDLLESKYIIGIEGNTKNSIEYSKEGKELKKIDNQENKLTKEISKEKKNVWAKPRSRSKTQENER